MESCRDYLVERTFSVMDLYDDLSESDKKYFLGEAIRGLDYGDDYDVTKQAVDMLDDHQHEKIIKDTFETISGDNCRYSLVQDLINELGSDQQYELRKWLNEH